MFDRFTERAHKTMSYSRMASEQFNHDYIGTEHMLLGLVRSSECVAVAILKEFGLEPTQVEDAVKKKIRPGPNRIQYGNLPFTPRAKKILEKAMDEARSLEHTYVGTEHLLLGMLHVSDGLASEVLGSFGLSLATVREKTVAYLSALPPRNRMPDYAVPASRATSTVPPSVDEKPGILKRMVNALLRSKEPHAPTPFDSFTDRARKALSFARKEAERMNHDYIGTEHILLGIVCEGAGVAACTLENLHVDLARVRNEIEKTVKQGEHPVTSGPLPFTPLAKRVLEYAIEEAKALDHHYVGTEHLLLGLMREENGLGGQVLENLGLTQEAIRKEVLKFLGG